MAEKKIASKTCTYQILSHQSGNALSVEDSSTENGALLTMDAPEKENSAQVWQVLPEANGCCRIVNTASKKAADIINGGTENGAWLHQWDSCEADTQLWKLVPASAGYYKIISQSSGKALDIVNISSETGAHLQIWEPTDGKNQEWEFVKLSSSAESQKAPMPKHRRCSRKAAKKAAAAQRVEAPKPTASIVREKPKMITKVPLPLTDSTTETNAQK